MSDQGLPEALARRRPSSEPVERPLPASPPVRSALAGERVRLEPLDPERHAEGLFRAGHEDGQPERWRFLAYGPFANAAEMKPWLVRSALSSDPLFFAICGPDGTPLGMSAFLNIHPAAGSIEIGHLWFGGGLQRRPAATEAIYLMIRHAMELGYRRVEWKCDAANQPSRQAARRFGFGHEGVFYRAMVVKGRNRDTAWYSILDEEWPLVRAGFEAWLDPANFDAEGRQRRRLAECRPG
ncbi:GNAT family N-acetyltransferase [Geminicoccus roseus]|uniref:GNAT family N-acetyltransferase n=1 Tax=Geminicoccus roseus TaxID=404900 RepID=UPI00041341B8|nr:GNAT family protein [Geminicoccus roseus]